MKVTDSSVSVPTLIIVSGLPATGKSTLARRLATHFALPLMTKDVEVNRLDHEGAHVSDEGVRTPALRIVWSHWLSVLR